MNRHHAQNTFGSFRIGNYMKSRCFPDAHSALEIIKKDCSEMLQYKKGSGIIRLFDEQGTLFYKGKLNKKGLTCILDNNNSLNLFFTIMNKDFTKEELAFLATPEKEVEKIALNVKEKAIKFKNLEQSEFNNKMNKVCNIIVVKKHNVNKVDINGWALFKKVAKPRDPGKVPFEKLGEKILKVYQLGKVCLSEQTNQATLSSNNTADSKQTQEATGNMDAQKFVSSLVRMIMVYTDKNDDFKSYLADKQLTLPGEISEFTNGIFKCEEGQDSIKLISLTGKEECVSSANGSREKFKQALETTVMKLVTNAAISGKTRERISTLVDMTSLEDMAYN